MPSMKIDINRVCAIQVLFNIFPFYWGVKNIIFNTEDFTILSSQGFFLMHFVLSNILIT